MASELSHEDICWKLCSRDPRNPLWNDIYGDEDLSDLLKPNVDCACDNCFYGRHLLAVEILKLRKELDVRSR